MWITCGKIVWAYAILGGFAPIAQIEHIFDFNPQVVLIFIERLNLLAFNVSTHSFLCG